jgi:hypothetical protein
MVAKSISNISHPANISAGGIAVPIQPVPPWTAPAMATQELVATTTKPSAGHAALAASRSNKDNGVEFIGVASYQKYIATYHIYEDPSGGKVWPNCWQVKETDGNNASAKTIGNALPRLGTGQSTGTRHQVGTKKLFLQRLSRSPSGGFDLGDLESILIPIRVEYFRIAAPIQDCGRAAPFPSAGMVVVEGLVAGFGWDLAGAVSDMPDFRTRTKLTRIKVSRTSR